MNAFYLDIENPQPYPVTVHLRLHDTRHDADGMNYQDRYNRTWSLPPRLDLSADPLERDPARSQNTATESGAGRRYRPFRHAGTTTADPVPRPSPPPMTGEEPPQPESTMRFKLFLLLFILVLSHPVCAGERPVVLFDQGHGQRFVIEQEGPLHLSRLAGMFEEKGGAVASGKETLFPPLLKNSAALVISGPFAPFAKTEIDAIVNWLFEGGNLALLLHIPMPVTDLLARLDVFASNGVIQERQNVLEKNDRDFQVVDLDPHPLLNGIQGFNTYGCWALLNAGDRVRIIARTSPQAWVDLNRNHVQDDADPSQALGTLVTGSFGKGNYVIFGDDAIVQNRFLENDNRRLAENLAAWLLHRPPGNGN